MILFPLPPNAPAFWFCAKTTPMGWNGDMFGADLTKIDHFTLSIISDPEVIAVNRASASNRELFHRNGFYGGTADLPGSQDKYLALFNAKDAAGAQQTSLGEIGRGEKVHIRDLWPRKDLGSAERGFVPTLDARGAGFYRVSGVR